MCNLISCDNQLVHNLNSLEDTFWRYEELNSGDNDSKVFYYLFFKDQGDVIWKYDNLYSEEGVEKRHLSELSYKYIFDPTSKQGVIIDDENRKYEYEIRGNLLHLYYMNDIIRIYTILNQ